MSTKDKYVVPNPHNLEGDMVVVSRRNTMPADSTDREDGVSAALNQVEKRTWDKQTTFLATYAEAGSIRKAAPAADTNRVTVYLWQRDDVLGFNERFLSATHSFREHLQDIALARIADPTGNRGSDVLVLGLLNAHWPEKYRPNTIVVDDTSKKVLAAIRDWGKKPKPVESETEAVQEAEEIVTP